jgi:hypothetical protein
VKAVVTEPLAANTFQAGQETAQHKTLAIKAALVPASKSSTAAVCGFCREAKGKLLLCSKCKAISYCNADHQRQHWYCWLLFVYFQIKGLLIFFIGIVSISKSISTQRAGIVMLFASKVLKLR